MDAQAALAFVREHGVVMHSAHVAGVPSLAEAIAGESIRGSWWGHPAGKRIFNVLGEVCASPEVRSLRLVAGKLTLAHRRTWPALAALADALGPERLTAITERHTERGTHETLRVPFPRWVPAEVLAEARALDPECARAALPEVLFASKRRRSAR